MPCDSIWNVRHECVLTKLCRSWFDPKECVNRAGHAWLEPKECVSTCVVNKDYTIYKDENMENFTV